MSVKSVNGDDDEDGRMERFDVGQKSVRVQGLTEVHACLASGCVSHSLAREADELPAHQPSKLAKFLESS